MGANTSIEWARHSFNPWWGCIEVSPGCDHCYARTFAKRTGHAVWGPAKNTERRKLSDAYWRQPEQWNAEAEREGERARVFCASMADVFENHPDVLRERALLFNIIERTPWLDWLLLTKRPQNVMRMVPAHWHGGFPPNVWIGTSVENQHYADLRIPVLLGIPAAVHFLSCEPLLGPVSLRQSWRDYLEGWDTEAVHACGGNEEACHQLCPEPQQYQTNHVDWVIVGGESGPGARPFDIAWASDLVAQCRAAGVAPFVKQLGAKPYASNVNLFDFPADTRFGVIADPAIRAAASASLRLRDPKGGDWSEWPADLRVREMPAVRA